MRTVMKNTALVFCIFVCSAGFAVAAVDYNQPLTADANTVGLWHMNTINRAVVADANVAWTDDYTGDPVKQLNIINTSGINISAGQAITGPTTALSNAIYISGPSVVGWEAFQAAVWNNNYDTVKVEAWVKLDDIMSLTRNLFETDSWRIQRWSNGSHTIAQLGLIVNFTDGTSGQIFTSDITDTTLNNKWIHITAEFDRNKHMSFKVFSQDGTFNQTVAADFPGKFLEMGGSAVYMGWTVPIAFDEVRISATDYTVPPAPAWLSLNPYTDTAMGTYGLWHLNSVAGGITPDDDSVAIAPRNFDMQLFGSAAIENVDPKFGSNIVINGLGDFAKCVAALPYGPPLSKFTAEAWFKVDPVITFLPVGMYYIVSQDPTFFLALEVWENPTSGVNELYADFRVRSPQGYKQVESLLANDGDWHHVAGAFDHGTVKIYVDGVEKAIGVLPAGATTASAPEYNYFIGSDGAGEQNFFGRIDEVRISAFNLICGDLGYLPEDFNHDCIVNFKDFAAIASQWMQNTLH